MAVNLGTVYVGIEARLKDLTSGLAQASKELGRFESDTLRRTERMSRSFKDFGRSMSIGITAPLLLAGKTVLDSAVRMDSLTRSLTSLTGNAKETEKQLGRLREAAKLPGLGFRELIEGTVRLQSAGLSAQQAESALKGFGNALALAGGSKEDLREVGVQLAQIASSGKLQGDELRIIAERVPQVRAVLKEAFGTASSEEISKFGLGVEEILGKITAGLHRLPQATDSAQNKFDNFSDTLDDLKRAVGDAFLPAITEGLDNMSLKVQAATKWFKELPQGAQEGLGKLALTLGAGGPLMIALGGLLSVFGKIAASPFFKFLLKAGKSGFLGPGMVGALMPEYKGGGSPFSASQLNDPAFMKEYSRQQAQRLDEERRLTTPGAFPFGTPKPFVDPSLPKTGWGLRPPIFPVQLPPGMMRDPLTGVPIPMPTFAKTPGVVNYAEIARKKKEAEDAAKKARQKAERQAEFAKAYSIESQIEILNLEGHPFRADVKEARQKRAQTIEKGGIAARADAERVFVATVKSIWAKFFIWRDEQLKKPGKNADVNIAALDQHFAELKAFEASRGRVSGGLNALRSMGTNKLSGAWGKFGNWLNRPAGAEGLGKSQIGQGQDFMAGIEQLAEMERQRALDALLPKGPTAPEGFLGKDMAQQLKPKTTPFTFELGKHLGDNLAMEMGREFGTMFDKVFGTGNPLARALSRTLSRLVDDLMFSIAQKAIGKNLMISLFGGGGGGMFGGGGGAPGGIDPMTGNPALGAAAGAKAAGLTAGQAWAAGFYVAAFVGVGTALQSIFKGTPQGKANLKAAFANTPGFQSAAMVPGSPGVNVYFNNANFNNDMDPKRAAESTAWHIRNKLASRPGYG